MSQETVTLYRVHKDYKGKLAMATVRAHKKPSTYHLLERHIAWDFMLTFPHDHYCILLSREAAIQRYKNEQLSDIATAERNIADARAGLEAVAELEKQLKAEGQNERTTDFNQTQS